MNFLDKARNFLHIPIPESRLNVKTEEMWGCPMTYTLSLKIFAEYMDPSDVFGNARVVTKSWRNLASQNIVMQGALQRLGFCIPPEVAPHYFFSSISKGLFWVMHPLGIDIHGFESISRELITIAKNNPGIFTENHRRNFQNLYSKEMILLLLLILKKEDINKNDYDICITLFSYINGPLLNLTDFVEATQAIDDFYAILSLIQPLFIFAQYDAMSLSTVLQFMNHQRLLLPAEKDWTRVNYRNSGSFTTVGALREGHQKRWKDSVMKAYALVIPGAQQMIRNKWPSLFAN